MAEPSEIYDHIIAVGEPLQFTGVWSERKPPDGFVELKLSPAELRSQLLAKFAKNDLVKAGVFKQTKDDKLRMNSLLREGPRVLNRVRRLEGSPTSDILGDGFLALSGTWAAEVALRNCYLEFSVPKLNGRLIAVPILLDCACLQSIGIWAIPAMPFHQLVARGVELLKYHLHLKDRPFLNGRGRHWPDTTSPAINLDGPLGPSPIVLVLVDWNIGNLDLADVPLIHDLERQFEQFDASLGFDLHGFSLWKPTVADLEKLKFAIERGPMQHCARAFFECMAASSRPLKVSRPDAKGFRESMRDDVRRMVIGDRQTDQEDERRKEWDEFRRTLDRELIEPLRQHAAQTDDLFERQRLLKLAALNNVAHPAIWRVIVEYTRPGDGGLPRKIDIEELEAALKTFRQIDAATRQKRGSSSSEQSDV